MSSIKHEPGASVPPIKVYPDKFADHVVVVTGAASGLGEAIARLFAQQGAHVMLLDIDQDNLKRVQESIQQEGGEADTYACNVSDEQNVTDTIEAVISKAGKIDVLAHLAGVFQFRPFVSFPTDVYRHIISTNLDSSFFLTRAVLPHMQEAGYGRIILTSSSTAGDPGQGLSAYVASKAGVIGLARSAALEAGPGVTVNVVLPGLIDTAGVQQIPHREALFEAIVSGQVVKRRGHPLDIAHAFSFIASPEASFYTGQTFECSGGKTFH